MCESNLIDERKVWSEVKIENFRQVVRNLPEVTEHDDLCIYVTGSFGRLEASEYSDLDLFFIKSDELRQGGMSRIGGILMNAAFIKACRDMGFPEFSGDGEYLEVHYLDKMLKQLGGRMDDYDNLFTARLLLLLESRPIYNEQLYEETLHKIIGSYFRDYQDHEDSFRPTFLVNDILRFWKTLCLNYEHGRNRFNVDDAEAQKSQLRNLKLKFSRMLTCFSLVIPLAVSRTSIGLDECIQLAQQRPLDRLRNVAFDTDNGALWDTLDEEYSWFLERTGQNRDEVINWVGSSSNRQEGLERAGRFGDAMYELLNTVAKPETMRYLVI